MEEDNKVNTSTNVYNKINKLIYEAAKSIKRYFLIWNNKHTKRGSMRIEQWIHMLEEQRNKVSRMELEFKEQTL